MGVEPEDFCRTCDMLLPFSELHKHIASCKENVPEEEWKVVTLKRGIQIAWKC